MTFSVMFARFPYGGTDRISVTDWLVGAVVSCKLDPRVSSVYHIAINDTPITMSRNKAVEAAKAAKADYLVMVDSDMLPDAYLPSNKNRLDTDSSARPFWDSSWEFMLRHREHGPCMVGSPYCGPSPHQNVYVFRWATFQNDHPNADLRIEQYTREEAVIRSGFEEVACLPTGLVIIDMRVFDNPLVNPPYFTYEYTDKYEMKKASTEDCVFTRDLNMANIPLYCNWDAWSGHWKQQCVGRPKPIFREQVHQKFVDAVQKNVSMKQKLVFVQEHDGDVPGADSSPPAEGGAGSEYHGAGAGQDDPGAVEPVQSNFPVSTQLPTRNVPIGVFHRGAAQCHTDSVPVGFC